jgi:hypothetical protein
VKLKGEHKKVILEEFDFAVKKMREKQSAEDKLFFFSGTYGAISRVFNISFDPQLVFIHFVLNTAYTNIMGRLNAIKGGDKAVQFPEWFFDRLTDATEDLGNKIEKGQDTYLVLEKINNLVYLTTGNGYYLLEKGMLKI